MSYIPYISFGRRQRFSGVLRLTVQTAPNQLLGPFRMCLLSCHDSVTQASHTAPSGFVTRRAGNFAVERSGTSQEAKLPESPI